MLRLFDSLNWPDVHTVPTWFSHFIKPAIEAAGVTIEIALVGLLVSLAQLQYMKRRDRALDIQNAWTETHKLMMIFRYKREILNLSRICRTR